MKKIIIKIGITVGILSPLAVLAAGKDLKYLIDIVMTYIGYAVFFILALATIMFVWNVYKYFISSGDNAESKKEAGLYVMWSIVGFFVILSLWGLVNILLRTFNLDNNAPTTFFGVFKPSIPGWTQNPGGSTNRGWTQNPGGSTNGI